MGDVVTISGELGTGKTTFVRGAAGRSASTEPVTSPTFTIGHRYAGASTSRTSTSTASAGFRRPSGVTSSRTSTDAIVFVEWPEAGADALPPARVEVRLEHAGGDDRRVQLVAAETALLEGIA